MRPYRKPVQHSRKPHSGNEGIRITSGEWRGRLVQVPQSGGVRPMLSKTRMAMFNVLADDIKGAKVWDCFAGSGLLGLEALSRGAEHCTFIEADRRHADMVQANIDLLGAGEVATLKRGDAFRIVAPGGIGLKHAPADFVLLDPPHAMIEDLEAGPFWPWLMKLHETPIVDGYTVVIIGHHAHLHVPQEIGAFMAADRRIYGSVGFTILVRTEQPPDEDA